MYNFYLFFIFCDTCLSTFTCMNKEKNNILKHFFLCSDQRLDFCKKKKKKERKKKNHPKIAGLGRLREPLLITLFDKIMGKIYIFER
jgi:hypothetical protein